MDYENKQNANVGNTKTCFVGGITLFITKIDIENYFSKFGPISWINFPKKKKKRLAKGFCLVGFKNEKDCKKAISNSEHIIKNLKLRVKSGIDSEKAKSLVLQRQARKLFVANLAQDSTVSHIRSLLSRFGQVEDITMQHKFIGREKLFKGYAFVLMSDEAGYQRGLKAGEILLSDRRIEIKKALPKGKKSEPKVPSTSERDSSQSSPSRNDNYCFRLEGVPRTAQRAGILTENLMKEISEGISSKKGFLVYSLKDLDQLRLSLVSKVLSQANFEGRHTIVMRESKLADEWNLNRKQFGREDFLRGLGLGLTRR